MTKRLQLIVLLLVIPALVTGCSWKSALTTVGIIGAAGAGAAAVYYAKGDLEGDFDNEISDVADASVAALEENGYKVLDTDVDDDRATITAEEIGTDRDMTIKLTRNDGGETHISIRYGLVGDESKSRDVYDDIVRRLK
jgi:hypothetical protein